MPGHLWGDLGDHLPAGRYHGRRHLRGVPRAAVGEGAVGHGLLNRGDVRTSLAEGHQDVLARVPGGIRERLRVGRVQPHPDGLTVNPPLDLGRQVDPGQLAQAVRGRRVLNRGDPILGRIGVEQVAQVVEEVVARHGECPGNVVGARGVAHAVVEDTGCALVLAARRFVGPVVDVRGRRGKKTGLEGGGRRVQFERRPRGIEAADGPVDERLVVQRVGQNGVVGLRDTTHPHSRVVTRVRRHRVYRPGFRVHDDHSPTGGPGVTTGLVVACRIERLSQSLNLRSQRVVGHLLEMGVDVGDDVRPGLRRRRLEHTGHLALGVDLELLGTRRAVEGHLVLVLETRLAEGVAGQIALRRPGRQFGGVDRAHIADDLSRRVRAQSRTW